MTDEQKFARALADRQAAATMTASIVTRLLKEGGDQTAACAVAAGVFTSLLSTLSKMP